MLKRPVIFKRLAAKKELDRTAKTLQSMEKDKRRVEVMVGYLSTVSKRHPYLKSNPGAEKRLLREIECKAIDAEIAKDPIKHIGYMAMTKRLKEAISKAK